MDFFSTGNKKRKASPLHNLDKDDDDDQHPQNLQIMEAYYKLEENGFGKFLFNLEIIRALERKSVRNPRPFQIAAIHQIHNRRDVLVRAKAGSGKTLPFLAIILDCFCNSQYIADGPTCIIFAPTDAICEKVHTELMSLITLARMRPPRVALITSKTPSRELSYYLAESQEIIISTPDHVLSGIEKGNLRPSENVTFILDEMDLLMFNGYGDALKSIIEKAPEMYQCWVSSSPSFDVKKLRSIIQRNPCILTLQEDDSVKSEIIPSNVEQTYILCEPYEKFLHIIRLLNWATGTVLIFTNSVDMCKNVKFFIDRYMHASGCALVDSDSPDKSPQSKGDGAFYCFVATHANLIDSMNADFVINFDVPATAGEYVRGLKCTGTAGLGELCTLASPEEEDMLSEIIYAVENELGDSDFIFPESRCFFSMEDMVKRRTEEVKEAKRMMKPVVNEDFFSASDSD